MINISIIIPVYNSEKHLKECLDSIVKQSLTDIEIICVNDGSLDGSLQILEEYRNNDSRVLIIDKKNEGAGVARNVGIELAKGKYIYCVDSDDMIHINTCEVLYAVAIENDLDLFQLKRLDRFSIASDVNLSKKIDYSKIETLEVLSGKEFSMNTYSASFACGKLWRTDFLRHHQLEFSNLKVGEDQLIVFNSFLHSKRFAIGELAFYFYRIHNESLTFSKKGEEYLNGHCVIAKEMFKIIKEENLWNYFGFMKRLFLILFRLNKNCSELQFKNKASVKYKREINSIRRQSKKMRSNDVKFRSHIERFYILPRLFWRFFKMN